MCRKNDIGPYAKGNCYIATSRHNSVVRGFKETSTHSIDLGDWHDQRHLNFKYSDPLAALIAAEEGLSEQDPYA